MCMFQVGTLGLRYQLLSVVYFSRGSLSTKKEGRERAAADLGNHGLSQRTSSPKPQRGPWYLISLAPYAMKGVGGHSTWFPNTRYQKVISGRLALGKRVIADL